MRRLAFRAALAAAAVAVIGTTVAGYLIRRNAQGAPIAWDLSATAPNQVAGRITYYIDTSGVPDVTPQQFADAVRAAVGAWEAVPHSAIAFEEDPARPAGRQRAGDRINRLGYQSGSLGPLTFAAAFVSVSGKRITDSDVVFNPTLFWDVVSPGAPGKGDIQGVCTHEWGHGIGLDHVPAARSTMFYAAAFGAVSLRSLEADDAAAIAHSYPDPSRDADYAAILGRVDVFGTANDRGVQVTAVDLITGLPAASNLSQPDGSYEIRGLAPGAYYLMASPIGTQKVEIGVYGDFWDSAATRIVPAIRGQGGAGDGSTGVVLLDPGLVVEGVDFAVAVADDPLEPNDSIGSATPLAQGRSAAARIEDVNDHDFFSFDGAMGDRVTVLLHARQIGSDLDPRLYLRSPSGIVLETSQDISIDSTRPEGADPDCRIVDFTLPVSGTYYLEVEAEVSPEEDQPEDYFYVLTILPSGGGASPYTSSLAASPDVAPADGASTVTLTFTPRTAFGTPADPGASISFDLVVDGDPDGTLSPVPVNGGDGTWTTTLTAPAAPGADTVNARVDGVPVRAVSVAWRGPADFAMSDFAAAPRRIRFDGASPSSVVLFPRDAAGIPFGPGRSVVLSLAGSPDASIGATADRGDGSYAAVITAGTVPEDLAVEAFVDGQDLGGSLPVGVGFPLGPVIDETHLAVAGLVPGLPGPRTPATRRLLKARDLLDAARLLDPDLDAPAILAAAKSAAAHLEAAVRKGADAGALARDLAEGAREAAQAAIDAATPLADTPAEERSLAKAQGLFQKGEGLLDAGRAAKAVAKHRSALRRAQRVE